jgi:pyruvate kinase
MRRTKIIATLGPTSSDFQTIEKLAEAGASIFRLNFSHGTHESHGEVIKRIKRLNQKSPTNYAILLDTKGPEIRSGDLKTPIMLEKGQTIVLSVSPQAEYEVNQKIPVNYEAFIHDVEEGSEILVDNGVMSLRVVKKNDQDIHCQVIEGGELKSRRHLNLPGKSVSLESITEKDWADIKFGIEMGVDFIALSFVRKSTEIETLREFLKKENSHAQIIAKIESFEATHHLGTIAEAADALMVARGDLGAEIPFWSVPKWQREIVNIGSRFQKPVIVATHMLESMIHNPMPTRAEVTDVSEAVWQRADGIMLSGETANGDYPTKALRTMAQIAQSTEEEFLPTRKPRQLEVSTHRSEFAKLASQMAFDLSEIKAIFVITRSGFMAKLVSGFRPKVPIFAFTNTPSARRQMQLIWGVYAFRIDFSSVPQKTIDRAREHFLKLHPEYQGQKFILVSDSLVGKEYVPTLQIRDF